MDTIASQITSLAIVFSTVYIDIDQRKHQSSASLAFVWEIHRGPVNSPHKWLATRKMFPFDDVIMSAALVWLQNFSHLLAEIVRFIWLIMCNGHLWNTSYYVSHVSYANILTRVESPHKDLVLQNVLPCQDNTIPRNYPTRYSHINCNQSFQLGVLRRNQTWCWSTHVSFIHHFIKVPISFFLHMCEVGHILYICHCLPLISM